MARHGHLDGVDPAVIAQVTAMSPATIDRRLADARTGLGGAPGHGDDPARIVVEELDPDEDLA
jgi:hypothetical protein